MQLAIEDVRQNKCVENILCRISEQIRRPSISSVELCKLFCMNNLWEGSVSYIIIHSMAIKAIK